MKKNIFLATALLFSFSAQAQIFDIIKSAVKDKTGVDLNVPVKNNATAVPAKTTTTTSGSNPSSSNLGNLTSGQISSGLKEALSMGVTDGVKKLAVTDGFSKMKR
ncbi:uncharacterized protein DUF4197 [Chryseobacterium sp. CBTAP 102]|uniref:DUF4197 domain-containing protein n=1 Tax=Chryseobacterium sp. CBTAP 102 TaxID=2135644 RepID=UPI000D8CEBBC|nr:DUF4197 domain-containing protein [Chryseobacterium sp. CBTAP 102]PXW14915.1 uncharacterized protein DUF4197 [Chryseobacterium sp. CBTAP 102]